MLVLEIAALRRQHPSRLSHHTHAPGRRSGRAACRGIPINPSAGCCTQDTPLVETQSAQQPWSQSPLHLSRATCCSQSSGCQRGHPAASVHLGTHSEISTTNIQQLNKTTDTPCAMQKVFVLLVCFQMTLAEPRQGDRLQKGTPHHHEHKVPGEKKGLWHQSDLQVLGKISECGEMARVKEVEEGAGHPKDLWTHSTTRDKCKKISTNVHSYFIIYRTRGSPALDTVPSASAGRSMEKGSNQN